MWAAAALLSAVLLAGQAAGDRLVSRADQGGTGATIGRAGSAYLTGLRTFAAAVLWNRLDPIHDTYYSGRPLEQQQFLVPSVRIITWLDPTFQQAFYAGPWIIYDIGDKKTAFEMAQEGIRDNPDSPWLRSSYAQMLLAEGRFPEARQQADKIVTERWTDPGDEYDALPTLEIIFNKTGSPDLARQIVTERLRLQAKYGFGKPGSAGSQ